MVSQLHISRKWRRPDRLPACATTCFGFFSQISNVYPTETYGRYFTKDMTFSLLVIFSTEFKQVAVNFHSWDSMVVYTVISELFVLFATEKQLLFRNIEEIGSGCSLKLYSRDFPFSIGRMIFPRNLCPIEVKGRKGWMVENRLLISFMIDNR